MTERSATRLVFGLLSLTILASLGLLALYVAGGNPPLEGILLMLALGGVGAGMVVWSQQLVDARVVVEERDTLSSRPADRAAVADSVTEEAGITRRRTLVLMLFGAIGAIGAAAVVPLLSLGPAPDAALRQTSWRKGLRLVDTNGNVVTTDTLPVGGITTVFPEGTDQPSDSAAVLVHVDPNQLQLPPDRTGWAPNGLVCYSKLCTHVGCPVGLFVEERNTLLCPCHQSEFDVLRAAQPVAGPAGRPLPQLPIESQADGSLVALGDFSGPVGPSFWDMYR